MRARAGWVIGLGLLGAVSSSCGDDGKATSGPGTSGDSTAAGVPNAAGSGHTSGGKDSTAAGTENAPGGAPNGTGASAGEPDLGGAASGGEPGVDALIAAQQDEPTGIALDAKYVYWASRGSQTISRCPLNGCGKQAPAVLVADAGEVRGIAVDAQSIYWTGPGTEVATGLLQKCPLAGCGAELPTLLATIPSDRLNDVHVVGTSLYYAAWPEVGVCTVDDCAPNKRTSLALSPAVSIDTDSEYIYIARHGWQTVARCAQSDCPAGGYTDLVTMHKPASIAVDAARLYFAEDGLFGFTVVNPGIFSCPIAGCGDLEPETLLDGIHPYAIALNATHLYYTDVVAGTVNTLAK